MHHDLAFDTVAGLWGVRGAYLLLGLGASVVVLLVLVAASTRHAADARGPSTNIPLGYQAALAFVLVALVVGLGAALRWHRAESP